MRSQLLHWAVQEQLLIPLVDHDQLCMEDTGYSSCHANINSRIILLASVLYNQPYHFVLPFCVTVCPDNGNHASLLPLA